MNYRFVINLRPKVKKNGRPIHFNKGSGKHFIGKSKELKAYEKESTLLLRSQANEQKLFNPIDWTCFISVQFDYEKHCPADVDNLVTMAFDLLKDAKVIKDDNVKVIKKFTCEVNEYAGQFRTVITIQPYEQKKIVSGVSFKDLFKSN